MTGELSNHMAELRALTPTLNAATDEAHKLIDRVESLLAETGIGVAAQTDEFHRGRPTFPVSPPSGRRKSGESSVSSSFYLAFGRVDGKFQIHVLEEASHCYDPLPNEPSASHLQEWSDLGSERTLWRNCSREMKLRSVQKLEELLSRILENSKSIAEQAEASIKTVKEMLGEIDQASSGPPLRAKSVQRLKGSKGRLAAAARQKGIRDGERWASEDAEADELQRLEAHVTNRDFDLSFNNSAYSNGELLFFAIHPKSDGDREYSADFWQSVIRNSDFETSDSADYLQGFIDGAIAHWTAVKDEI